MRHGGIIPHDDDIDIGCFEDDFPAIQAAVAASELLVDCGPGNARHQGLRVARITLGRHAFGIDVFLRQKPLDRRLELLSEAECFPLTRIGFHGLTVSCPGGDPRGYLRRSYGTDWADTVKVFFNHMPCRRRLTLPIDEYTGSLAAAGYVPVVARESAAAALEDLDRGLLLKHDCGHCTSYEDAERELWDRWGWGSPLGVPADALPNSYEDSD